MVGECGPSAVLGPSQGLLPPRGSKGSPMVNHGARLTHSSPVTCWLSQSLTQSQKGLIWEWGGCPDFWVILACEVVELG